MAIKNFIKKGTYTKIINIQWRDGHPTLCVVATYEKAPSEKYVPFKEVDSKDEDGKDIKQIEFQNPEIERLQTMVANQLGYKLVGHRLELYAVPLSTGPEEEGI